MQYNQNQFEPYLPKYFSRMYETSKKIISTGLLATLCTGTILAGDGTNERGFVPPPRDLKMPPAPPRSVSSAETLLACCCCPVTPMTRTKTKKPPQPPVLVTKIRDERIPK